MFACFGIVGAKSASSSGNFVNFERSANFVNFNKVKLAKLEFILKTAANIHLIYNMSKNFAP